MRMFLIGAIPAFLWTAGVAAGEVAAVRTVDLNLLGALEAVQRSRPAHYDKIGKIVKGLFEQPDSRASHWVQTTFNARNVSYPQVFLVSFPAQRRLSFTLDDTHYVVTLTLTVDPAHSIAIRNSK